MQFKTPKILPFVKPVKVENYMKQYLDLCAKTFILLVVKENYAAYHVSLANL